MSTLAEITGFPVHTEPAVTSVSSAMANVEAEVHFSVRAYSKMILHAAKYPHCAINGVLLAKSDRKRNVNSGLISVSDCIPLFHQIEGLSPMVEVALAQIETRSAAAGLYICGYYHANRSLRDTSVNIFSQRIADKVAELSPNNQAILVTLDNRRLGLVLETPALIAQMAFDGKWRSCATKNIHLDEDTLAVTSALLQKKTYKDLADFDNHLDDLTQDYLNVAVNMEINKCS